MKFADDFQKKIINDLINKSHNDSNFKGQFISNPEKVIESSYNIKVSDNVKLVVEDQSDKNIIFFNIPRKVDVDELELTEAELEMVSGGSTGWCVIGAGLAVNAIYDFVDGFAEGVANHKRSH